MSDKLCLIIASALLFLVVTFVGCGTDDLVFPGMALPTPTATPIGTPTCLQSGDGCTLNTDCCSGQCITPDGETFECE